MQRKSSVWTAAWTQAVTDISGGPDVSDVTLRIQVRLDLTGSAIRFVLSNRFGTKPLLIGDAAMAFPGGSTRVLFGGRSSVEVPPGGECTCDAAIVDDLAAGFVTIFLQLPGRAALSTGNIAGAGWSVSDPGGHIEHSTNEPITAPFVEGQDGVPFVAPTPLIRAVEILTDDVAAAVVCLGDSITAAGWPNRASMSLADARVILLNRGIPGNRLCRAGSGPAGSFFGRSGLDRFADDVLATSGVTHVVLALGTNDLGHPGSSAAPPRDTPHRWGSHRRPRQPHHCISGGEDRSDPRHHHSFPRSSRLRRSSRTDAATGE